MSSAIPYSIQAATDFSLGDQEWVKEWMDQLLDEDKEHYASFQSQNIKTVILMSFVDTAYKTLCSSGRPPRSVRQERRLW